MKCKKSIVIIILIIILLSIIFSIYLYFRPKDYEEISKQFYIDALKKYNSSENQDILYITPENFVNLSSQQKLSDDKIQEIISNFSNIKLMEKENIGYNKNIDFYFVGYDINLFTFYISLYEGDIKFRMNICRAKYKNNKWDIIFESFSQY